MYDEFKSFMMSSTSINPLPERVASIDFKFKKRSGLDKNKKKKVVNCYELRSSDASDMIEMAKSLLAMRA